MHPHDGSKDYSFSADKLSLVIGYFCLFVSFRAIFIYFIESPGSLEERNLTR